MTAAETRRGYAVSAGEGVDHDPALKASATSTGGAFTLIESRTDGGAPPHVHAREDEAMYVLDGRIVVHVGDDEFTVEAGGFVFMPRGVLHDWDVVGGHGPRPDPRRARRARAVPRRVPRGRGLGCSRSSG